MTHGLLLDEMFAPVIARTLRDRGYDVVSVAEDPELRALPDPELHAWAVANGRWLVTENVRDFQPLVRDTHSANAQTTGLLFTASRTFPRSRGNPGPLIAALDSWLGATETGDHGREQWLAPPGG